MELIFLICLVVILVGAIIYVIGITYEKTEIKDKVKDEVKDEVKEKKDRKGFAIAAIVLGIISLIIIPLLSIFNNYLYNYVTEIDFTVEIEILGILCVILTVIFSFIATGKNRKLICVARLIGVIVIIIYLFSIYIYYEASTVVTDNAIALKPIIYLYPEEETEVSVELGYSEKITVSYPEYNNGWNVIAKTNGDLTEVTTNRGLYSLYYESENVVKFKVEKEGFVVKGEETAEFLEEKLEILGLTQREAEEFIIYWLPQLQENEYNYIRFATAEEIEENMPLTINPEPDTVIRVLMTYKGLDEQIEVEEQELETPERTGFVAVEWGGTEI